MEYPTPELVRAEHRERGRRARRIFAGGTSEAMAELARERSRLETEARATRRAYERHRDRDTGILMIRAQKALEEFENEDDGAPKPAA